MSSEYGLLRPTNGWDRFSSLGHPNKFQRVSRLRFVILHRRRSTEANQTLHNVWPSPGLVHCIFGGSCPLTEFCQVHNSLCVQVLRSPIFAALLHATRAAGVSHSLRRGTRNGIAKLSQRAAPIFGRAAITLGIGSLSGWSRNPTESLLKKAVSLWGIVAAIRFRTQGIFYFAQTISTQNWHQMDFY